MLITRALRAHPTTEFQYYVIETFDTEDEAYDAEGWWIEFLRTNVPEYGFNIRGGGEHRGYRVASAQTARMKWTEARYEKMRPHIEASRGRPRPRHVIDAMIAAREAIGRHEMALKTAATKKARGTDRWGKRNKLTFDDVGEILARIAAGERTTQLQREYRLQTATMRDFRRGLVYTKELAAWCCVG